MQSPVRSAPRVPTHSALKRWTFRVAAILLGLAPFVLLELVLIGWDLPSQPPPADPYVDLHNLRPLFEFDAAGRQMQISPERLNLFRPAAFPVDKAAGTFRVFALGASTTQGEPYSTETAFPQWLKLNLQAAAGETRPVEVINCGGLSYASYRVLAILREVLTYHPDLIVIYTGHNEYLEYRTYAGYQQPSPVQAWLGRLGSLRTVQVARRLVGHTTDRSAAGADRQNPPPATAAQSPPDQRTVLKTEVDALLDYQGGLEDYRRGADWYKPIPEHFRWNLQQMVQACRRADVPLILIRPVSNLLDCPPMKFEPDPLLTPADRQQFELHWEAARSLDATPQRSLEHIIGALAIDPQHAGANYALGQLQVAARDFDAAHASLLKAKDFDVCPLRAPSAICDAVTTVAEQAHVPLVDAEVLFSDRSPHGLVGNLWLVDHIHPNLEGHQLLGERVAQACFDHRLFTAPIDDWKSRRKALYAAHLASLSEAYFHRGKQRLEGLLLWTQGRAKKIKPAQ